MNKLLLIRFLVVCSLGFYMAYFFSPYFYEKIYDPNVLSFLFSSPVKPILSLSDSVSWLFLVFHVIAAVALFIQIVFARYLYIASVLIGIAVVSLSGISAYTGLDILLISLLNMSDGVILYLAFSKGEKL